MQSYVTAFKPRQESVVGHDRISMLAALEYVTLQLLAIVNVLGVKQPFVFFVPLSLSNDGDLAAFRQRHDSEIEHRCISMLAAMECLTPELSGSFLGFVLLEGVSDTFFVVVICN